MEIKCINENTYTEFISKQDMNSFYQSVEWMNVKIKEGKRCELIGLYENDKLIGVSLIIYIRILHSYYFAYASRGFVYDYKNVKGLKEALKEYFKNKKVVFVKMDPPIILATYDKDLNKEEYSDSLKLINELKENGFNHFGFNMAAEAYQFRFVHRILLKETFEEQMTEMSKSTRKNIEFAQFRGAKIKKVDVQDLDEILRLFNCTINKKHFTGFSKNFYKNIFNEFKDNVIAYIVYVDKKIYIENIEKKLEEIDNEISNIKKKMENNNVGNKLKTQLSHFELSKNKYEKELENAHKMEDITNIASMICIKKYDEIVSLSSGMDDEYRVFSPKYVMYPEMFKDAIKNKLKYVNFLGVKNILDPNDENHGVYEVKRGFGGKTLEYIGEFDLPVNNLLYKIYKFKNKILK